MAYTLKRAMTTKAKADAQARYVKSEKGKDAVKKAKQKYESTEPGKEIRKDANARYFDTDKGKAALKKAQESYESKEERKAARAAWMREYRLRKKLEAQNNS